MPSPLTELLLRVKAGCPEAARLLVERYADLLRLSISAHLNARLRATHEADDVLQSVWKDFFARSVNEHDFATPEQLLGYLRAVCKNKVNQLHRRQFDADKRDRTRDVSLPVDLSDRHPGPEQLAEANDRRAALLDRVKPEWRRGFAMLLEGYSHREAAEAMGISERSLTRALELARKQRPATA